MTKIFKKLKLSLLVAVAGFAALSTASGIKPSRAMRGISYLALGDGQAESYVDLIAEGLEDEYELPVLKHVLTSDNFRLDDLYFELEPSVDKDEYFTKVFDAECADTDALNENVAIAKELDPTCDGDYNEFVSTWLKEQIEGADYITIDAGANNFSKFLIGKVAEIIDADAIDEMVEYFPMLDFGGADTLQDLVNRVGKDFDLDVIYGMVNDALSKILDANVSIADSITIDGFGSINIKYAAEMVAYSVISYTSYFRKLLYKVNEMNPEAKVVVIGLDNPLDGVMVELGDVVLPIGDMIGGLIEAANLYVRLTAREDSFYYVNVMDMDLTRRYENIANLDPTNVTATPENDRKVFVEDMREIFEFVKDETGIDLTDTIKANAVTDIFTLSDSDVGTVRDCKFLAKAAVIGLSNVFDGADIENINRIIGLIKNFDKISNVLTTIEEEISTYAADDAAIYYIFFRYVLGDAALNEFDDASIAAIADEALYFLTDDEALDALNTILQEIVMEVSEFLNELFEYAGSGAYVTVFEDAFADLNQAIRDFAAYAYENVINPAINFVVGCFDKNFIYEPTDWVNERVKDFNEFVGGVIAKINCADGIVLEVQQEIVAKLTAFEEKCTTIIEKLPAFAAGIRAAINGAIQNVIDYVLNTVFEAVDWVNNTLIPGVEALYESALEKVTTFATWFFGELAAFPQKYHDDFGGWVRHSFSFSIDEDGNPVFGDGYLEEAFAEIKDRLISLIEELRTDVENFEAKVLEKLGIYANDVMDGIKYPLKELRKFLSFVARVVGGVWNTFWTQHGEDCMKFVEYFRTHLEEETQKAIAAYIEAGYTELATKLTNIYNKLVEIEAKALSFAGFVEDELEGMVKDAADLIDDFLVAVENNYDPITDKILKAYREFLNVFATIFPHKYEEESIFYDEETGDFYAVCSECGWITKIDAHYVAFVKVGDTSVVDYRLSVTLPGNNTYKAETVNMEIEGTPSLGQFTFAHDDDFETFTATADILINGVKKDTCIETIDDIEGVFVAPDEENPYGQMKYTANFPLAGKKEFFKPLGYVGQSNAKWEKDFSACTVTIDVGDGQSIVETSENITPEYTSLGNGNTQIIYKAVFEKAEDEFSDPVILKGKTPIEAIRTEDGGELVVNNAVVAFDKDAMDSIPEGTTVSAKFENGALTIELTDEEGEEVKFKGKVTITLPVEEEVPAGYTANVYWVNGTEEIKMEATFTVDENGKGWVTFETDHFSSFVIRIEQIPEEPKPEPKKGLGLWWILIGVLALACVASLVYVFVIKPRKGNKEEKPNKARAK